MKLKIKFYFYLFLNSVHGTLAVLVFKGMLNFYLLFFNFPDSVKYILKQDLVANRWKLLVRRCVWLLNVSSSYINISQDRYFDFSIGLPTQASIDSYDLVKKSKAVSSFDKEVFLAQLSSSVLESQVGVGETVYLDDLLYVHYDDLYLNHIAKIELWLQKKKSKAAALDSSNYQGSRFNFDRIENSSNYLERFASDVYLSALDIFDELGVPVFATSGTFLGIIREGKFLSHDIDVDLGIFDADFTLNIIDCFESANNFQSPYLDYPCERKILNGKVVFKRASIPHLIRILHNNGVQIDLFVYYRCKQNKVGHGSSLHRWENDFFRLTKYDFLGRSILGPEDYDKYLTESYGDWRTPISEFNCSSDSPNLVAGDNCKMKCLSLIREFYC